jgi:hypothetical protein
MMIKTYLTRTACLAAFLFASSFFPQASAIADDWTFLDDRSSPQKLVESYYYAINNKLYVQAFSYFSEGASPKDFDTWSKGYAETKSVSVKFGSTSPDPGAGQIYWALPVSLSAKHTDGSTKVFAGCYTVHMINPGMQSDPPYVPMGIEKSVLKAVKTPFEKTEPGPCSQS